MNRLSSIHNTPPNGTTTITGGTLLTPIPNGVRRSSGGHTASSPANGDTSPQANGQPQHAPTSPLSPNTGADTWSSAIGHATTTGKSGRVIERLMAENDRLKRELKEQQTKADELQQRVQMCQPRIQALEAENGNLSHARDVDQTLLARRDRQNADLKEELESERKRRHGLTTRARELQSERDEAVEVKTREIQEMTEKTMRATVHADIMADSFRQEKGSNEARIEKLKRDIAQAQLDRDQDREKLARLSVVSDQMRQEDERKTRIIADMTKKWEEMREAYRISAAAMHKETTAETEKARKLSVEMDQVVNKMRWVMNLKSQEK